MRFGAYEIDCVFSDSFVLAEVVSGRAMPIRALSIRNVRGTERDWLKLFITIHGRRVTRQKSIRNLAVGDEKAAQLEAGEARSALTLPADTAPGRVDACLMIIYPEGQVEIPFSVNILKENVIPTDFARSDLLSAYVIPSEEVRLFSANILSGLPFRHPLEKARALYEALMEKKLLYQPVASTVYSDCQEISNQAYTLAHGGSCADLSLAFASLLWSQGLSPALLLFRDHMAAGIILSESLPFETQEGAGHILALMEEGALVPVELTAVCRHQQADFDMARELIARRLRLNDPCILIHVKNCLRSSRVIGLSGARSTFYRCPKCGFPKVEGQEESLLVCPACQYRFRLEQSASEPTLPSPKEYSSHLQFGMVGTAAAVIRWRPNAESPVVIPPAWQGKIVRKIGDRAFAGGNVSGILLPEHISAIGNYAFYQCRSLHNILLPQDVESLGIGAFSQSGITGVHIPGSVRLIPRMAFAQCAALEKVSLSEGIEMIDDRAFAGCGRLTSILIPSTVKRVGKGAFDPGCQIILMNDKTVVM